MKSIILVIVSIVIFNSCSQRNNDPKGIAKRIDRHWLDSIINNSDSSYTKPYKRTDFANAFFYINKKDSSVCQVMKDQADTIRQIIIARKNVRIFFAQYYANGQLQAKLPLDEYGQNHGETTYYYENGEIQNSGNYSHGLKMGKWKNYDEKGKMTSEDEYNANGQLIKTIKN